MTDKDSALASGVLDELLDDIAVDVVEVCNPVLEFA